MYIMICGADGVMIEGFGYDVRSSEAESDWLLQLDRALSQIVNNNKALICQSYDVSTVANRMFTLGSYLLIKGTYTYLNLDLGSDVNWYPEYTIPIGSPISPVTNAESLENSTIGMYVRYYTEGIVFVNPGTTTQSASVNGYLATPSGGGYVPTTGILPVAWTVTYTEVTQITVASLTAAIVLYSNPATPAAPQIFPTASLTAPPTTPTVAITTPPTAPTAPIVPITVPPTAPQTSIPTESHTINPTYYPTLPPTHPHHSSSTTNKLPQIILYIWVLTFGIFCCMLL